MSYIIIKDVEGDTLSVGNDFILYENGKINSQVLKVSIEDNHYKAFLVMDRSQVESLWMHLAKVLGGSK